MSKFKNYLLFVVVLAVAAAIIGSQARAWSKTEPKTLPLSIQLTDISKNPHALKNRKVVLNCRFGARGNLFRNKDDIFTTENHENFSVWSDDIQFWNKSELKTAYPTFYISKDNSDLINTLRILERFNEIEIVGIVESIYANMPWIRVEEIRLVNSDKLDQSMASQVTRGVEFIKSGEFQKARICFEIAQERETPNYVDILIESKLQEIEKIKAERILTTTLEEAKSVLEIARQNATEGNYESAATAYGKALKISNTYNDSPAIHKEIAGFFIDFYQSRNELELLDYSINEFTIAHKLLGKPDEDIIYALAYIETLRAKTSKNYTKAEKLARQCLELNTHHYGGRKLLADILSCQLAMTQEEEEILKLPTAPERRIVISSKRKPKVNDEDVSIAIDDLISEQELLAMENEIENIEHSLTTELTPIIEQSEDLIINESKEQIPGLTSNDFQGILGEIEINMSEIVEDNSASISLDTSLPDFPISENNSELADLAL